MEQHVVQQPGVAQRQRIELFRQGEDDMKVRQRQQLDAALLQPALLVQALTLRAMPIATGVVDDLACPAMSALVDMTAQGGGAAGFDGFQRPPLGPAETMTLAEGRPEASDDLSHLQTAGGAHAAARLLWRLFGGGGTQPVQRARHSGQAPPADVDVDHGCLDALMSQQVLDVTQIRSAFEQVGGEAVAQDMRSDAS